MNLQLYHLKHYQFKLFELLDFVHQLYTKIILSLNPKYIKYYLFQKNQQYYNMIEFNELTQSNDFIFYITPNHLIL